MDAENIKIIGRGILDNSRNTERILFAHNAEDNKSAVNNAIREHTVQLEYCTNVEIEGITIRDSLVYNIRPIGCRNLHISNVKIIGCWRYNSDGIDMHNCENVLIDNCFIRTFDDAICVKGFDFYNKTDIAAAVYDATYHNGEVYDVFKNVRVRSCTIWNDWGKSLEIGAETKARAISDIVFENCDIIHVSGHILDCYNIDYADVHDVVYRNINVEYDEVIPNPLIQNNDSEEYVNLNLEYSPNLIAVVTKCHPEYSAGSNQRGKNHDIRFENIHLFGRFQPKFIFEGYDEEHKTKDITIENVFLNGKLLTEVEKERFVLKDYTENIVYKATDNMYSQIKKNTVDSKNQLANSGPVRFMNIDGKGKRIMFVGNSITPHGKAPSIGWHSECGMAASRKENDYVHILMNKVNAITPDSQFCICHVAEWEKTYQDGESMLCRFENAREFDADIIIMRFIENCPGRGLGIGFDCEIFKKQLNSLLVFLNKSQKAKIILTTGFWRHPGDEVILEYAKEKALPFVELGDLGELDEMKAIGLFEHEGVANHPGDLGMKNIAERIFTELQKLL